MDKGFLLQFVGSVVAITVLGSVAWWAKLAKPFPPLDEATARALFDRDFFGAPIEWLWIDADREGAVAKSGDRALILFRVGDCYASRDADWAATASSKIAKGRVIFNFDDPAAPHAAFRLAEGTARAPFA